MSVIDDKITHPSFIIINGRRGSGKTSTIRKILDSHSFDQVFYREGDPDLEHLNQFIIDTKPFMAPSAVVLDDLNVPRSSFSPFLETMAKTTHSNLSVIISTSHLKTFPFSLLRHFIKMTIIDCYFVFISNYTDSTFSKTEFENIFGNYIKSEEIFNRMCKNNKTVTICLNSNMAYQLHI